MTFQKLFAGMRTDQRIRLAEMAETKLNHLWQVAGGHRRPSMRLAMRIVRASRMMFRGDKERWLSIEGVVLETERQTVRRESIQRRRAAARKRRLRLLAAARTAKRMLAAAQKSKRSAKRMPQATA